MLVEFGKAAGSVKVSSSSCVEREGSVCHVSMQGRVMGVLAHRWYFYSVGGLTAGRLARTRTAPEGSCLRSWQVQQHCDVDSVPSIMTDGVAAA